MADAVMRIRRRRLQFRRNRIIRDRTNPFDLYDDVEFLNKYRFDRHEVLIITDEIEEQLQHSNRQEALLPVLQVLLTLRFFATGSFLEQCAEFFGVVQSTASTTIRRVTKALLTTYHHWIVFANQHKANQQKQKFMQVAGFPNVFGCIDGTHVQIQAPTRHEDQFVNRKGFHSINVQDPRELFRKWRQQYGDIFSLRLGDRLVVVMSSYSVLKEAFVKHGDVFSDRPSMFMLDRLGKKRGVILSSGELWKEQRKVSLEILRELGLGKNILAEKIQEEIMEYIHAIEAESGLPFNPSGVTHLSVANVINSVTFGKRYQHGDQHFSKYMEALASNMKNVGGNAAILNFLPCLRYVPGDIFCFKSITRNAKMIDVLCQDLIAEHKKDYDEHSVNDFIGAYIREMKKKQDAGESTSLNEDNLWQTVGDLFAAGMETTATTLCWAMVFFLHYPEVQEKCYQHIVETIGTGRLPTIQDKPLLPYIEATAMEVLRRSNLVPFGVQHTVCEDVIFQGFSIPKDTIILPLMESVLLDEKIWSNPEEFRPERFLAEDGTCSKPEEFIPFSLGRRMCLGESLARMELFLFLSSMVQRFQFLPPEDGQLPSLDGILSVTYSPKPFKVRAVPRK